MDRPQVHDSVRVGFQDSELGIWNLGFGICAFSTSNREAVGEHLR